MSSKQEDIQKFEREKEELVKKEEEIKEKSLEAKIETAIKLGELAAEIVDHHIGIVEPVSAGMAGEVVKQGVEILRNHEATEAYIKGLANEKVIKPLKEFIADKFPEKDAVKEWENDIAQKEHTINEKFNKEIKETEKRLQKQLDYIEEKYDDNMEKKKKQNELKTTIKKVQADIEKDRNTELKQQEERKDNLEKIKVATKGMEENERQRIIQQQRELERKLELERKK